jgi:hypothetical protein
VLPLEEAGSGQMHQEAGALVCQERAAEKLCSEQVVLRVSQCFVESFDSASSNPILVVSKPSAETVWDV